MSRETAALIAYVKAKAPEAIVTATLGRYISPANPCSPHSAGSLHCADATDGKGLAVDWGGDEAAQAAVFHALEPVAAQLAELIHNGSGITRAVKNGAWVNPLVVYGATVWAAHTNHTHSAVPKGTFLVPPEPQPAAVSVAAQLAPAPPTVPAAVHDFEESTVKQTMVHVGPLDKDGNGWADWQPGLGRDPNPVGLVLLGPSPPDDAGYWPGQAKVTLAAQPRGGALRVTVRNGTPGDTITCFATVS